MIDSEKELMYYILGVIRKDNIDAVVVDGYDGVGKGRVLSKISEYLGVIPYRPDYNIWQKYDIRQPDRWKISGFFWDIYSHFDCTEHSILLFDRGVISGAVYNHDDRIARDYKKILGNKRVLHVLVCCGKEDYLAFQRVRSSDKEDNWDKCKEYTEEYKRCYSIAGVPYIVYKNHFDENIAKDLMYTCEGCGHYSYGRCDHPEVMKEINPTSLRCALSSDKEIQDRELVATC